MQAALAQFDADLALELIDVDSQTELARRFGTLVPVLAAADDIICHYELDRVALARHLAADLAVVPPGQQ